MRELFRMKLVQEIKAKKEEKEWINTDMFSFVLSIFFIKIYWGFFINEIKLSFSFSQKVDLFL